MPQEIRADALKSRQAILEAAAELSINLPVISKSAIARRARVTRQTLYRHFPTTEELIAALQETHFRDLGERAERINAAERVIPRMVVRHLVGEGPPFQARHIQILSLGHHPGCTAWASKIQTLLERAWPGNEPRRYPIMAHALVGAAIGWVVGGSPRSAPEAFEEVLLDVTSKLLFF